MYVCMHVYIYVGLVDNTRVCECMHGYCRSYPSVCVCTCLCVCLGIDWVPLPLDPGIRLTGLQASTASMFASAVYPCVIEFQEMPSVDKEGNQEESPKKVRSHKIMFKSGDDLRQDQLIMQMIALMDSLLKKVTA